MILAKGAGGIAAQPLALAAERGSYVVDRVRGSERKRLCELGLVEGAEVSVVNRSQGGTLVLKVGGSRLALAKGMAEHIWVK